MQKLYPDQHRELEQRRQEIVAVLKRLGQASLAEIATAVHMSENNTFNRLQMMAQEGLVKCLEVAGENCYSLEPEINKKENRNAKNKNE